MSQSCIFCVILNERFEKKAPDRAEPRTVTGRQFQRSGHFPLVPFALHSKGKSMQFRSKHIAAAAAVAVLTSGGFISATPASAVGLGSSSSSSSHHKPAKKKTVKKASHKKTTPKKKAAKKKAAPKKASSSKDAKRRAIVKTARQNLHVKYRFGGTTPKGWDCSGYTRYVFGKNGIKLPHSSSGQSHKGHRVSAKNAKPGDLIWSPGHVAIKSDKKGKMFDAGGHRTNTSERSYSWMVLQGARFISLV